MSYDKIIADGLAHKSEDPIVQKALNSARSLDRHSIAAELEHINASEISPLQKADEKKSALAKREKTAADVDSAIVEAFVSVERGRPPLAGEPNPFGAELTENYRRAPDDKARRKLLASSPETELAIAQRPPVLSGMTAVEHEELKNRVRARLWPEDAARREADLAALQAARVAHDGYLSTAKSTFKAKAITSAHQLPVPTNPFTG